MSETRHLVQATLSFFPTASTNSSVLKQSACGGQLTSETSKRHKLSVESISLQPEPFGDMSLNRHGGTAAVGIGGVQNKPVKKLVIKNLKKQPELDENFGEVTWETLRTAVKAIQESKPADSYEQLYKACENLCRNKMAPLVYERLKNECEIHVKTQLAAILSKGSDNYSFLDFTNGCWQDYVNQMKMIRQIFLYLDRVYVLNTPSVVSVFDMGLNLWRDYVATHTEVRRQIVQGLLALIERERNGDSIDRSLVASLVRMLVDLQIYESSFQGPFLQATQVYYLTVGEKYQAELDVPDFLLRVEGRLKEEVNRVVHYLDSSTKKPLIEEVEKKLLKVHATAMLEKGFDALMDDYRVDDLTRMFQLYGRVQCLDSLRAAFGVYVRKKGTEIVTGGEERDKTLVDDLLVFKEKMDRMVELAFASHELFLNTLKESFESFVNIRQNKPAELIAKFIDNKLRSGNKEQTDAELESTLDKVLILFRFIQGKDVFEAFYKKDLAKRLLLSKSASVDAEKSMLEKLKTECGAGFTSKLEGMFKDIDVSKDIMTLFKNSKMQEQLGDFELTVNVLTQGFWPTYPVMEVNLPPFMTAYQEIFKNFYLMKHSGRRLMWQNSLGTCVLKARFTAGLKELSVSLFQALVLLLFNDAEELSYAEIKTLTNIEDKELRRTLQSLACAKIRVLNKTPLGRDVNDHDRFVFAREFKNGLYRIKINQIQMKETLEEQQDTTERVFQDRQYQVDAAIVRIMKTRKQLSHILLMSELFEQLKFPVKPADLKKRIESLIDREYLERDSNNSSVYNYLA